MREHGFRRCDRCSDKAVFYRPYEGSSLCWRHFCLSVERKVKRFIKKEGLIKPGKVLVVVEAASSLLALKMLHSMTKDRKDVELFAFLKTKNRVARDFVKGLGVKTVESERDDFVFSCRGKTGDDIVHDFIALLGKRGANIREGLKKLSCEVLSVLRKDEAEVYLKGKGIYFSDGKGEDAITEFIRKEERERPGMVFSAQRSIRELQKL